MYLLLLWLLIYSILFYHLSFIDRQKANLPEEIPMIIGASNR
jgi:hypothetical protein